MLAILERELRTYFTSPIGYVFIGIFVFVAGLFFGVQVLFPRNPSFISVFSSLIFIFLLLIPILTMRLMSEDKNKKIDQLLFTSPLKLWEIILGKYFAAVIVYLFSIMIIGISPLIMSMYGEINISGTGFAFLGFFLLGCAFISIGLFISSTTSNQIVAAAATFGVLLAIWILDYIVNVLPTDNTSGIVFCSIAALLFSYFLYHTTKNKFLGILSTCVLGITILIVGLIAPSFYTGIIYRLASNLSMIKQLDGFMMGAIALGPIVYYLSVCFIFIYLTIRKQERSRWS